MYALSDFELAWVCDVTVGSSDEKSRHQTSRFAGPFDVVTEGSQIDVSEVAGFPFFEIYLATRIAATNISLLTLLSER